MTKRSAQPRAAGQTASASCVMLILLLFVLPNCLAEDRSDLEEERFIRQLQQRQLFDIASDYCRTRMSRESDTDRQARWLLRLSRIRLNRLWYLSAEDRDAVSREVIETITEFLSRRMPRERALQLHQCQIETLLLSARLSQLTAGAGRISLPESAAAASLSAAIGISDLPESDRGSAARARQLSEELLSQLQQERRELPSDLVRRLRCEARLMMAEATIINSHHEDIRQTESEDSPTELRRTAELLQQARAAAPDERLAQKTLLLETELQLLTGDADAVMLRDKVLPDVGADVIWPDKLTLQVRGLLLQRRPSDAAELCRQQPTDSRSPINQDLRQYLLLESLFAEYLLTLSLPEKVMHEEAAQRFTAAAATGCRAPDGVLAESARMVRRRFASVRRYGPEGVILLESAARLRAEGQPEGAVRLIQAGLRNTDFRNQPQSRAALALEAARAAADAEEWKTALQYADRAATEYRDLGESGRIAAADLIRCFCLGRIWSDSAQTTTGNSAETSTAAGEAYRASLKGFLETHPDHPSTALVRGWLAAVTGETDPLRSVRLILDNVQQFGADAVDSNELIDSGSLLVSLSFRILRGTLSVRDHRDLLRQWIAVQPDSGTFGEETEHHRLLQLQNQWLALILQITGDDDTASSESGSAATDQRHAPPDRTSTAADQAERMRSGLVLLGESVSNRKDRSFPEAAAAAGRAFRDDPQALAGLLVQFLSDKSELSAQDLMYARLAVQILEGAYGDPAFRHSREEAVAALRYASELEKTTDSETTTVAVLKRLPAGQLSGKLLQETADLLRQRTDDGSVPTASTAAVLARWWQQAGSAAEADLKLKLEAELQLAELALCSENPNPSIALRRLRRVEVVHPTWADPKQNDRATRLKQRLSRFGRDEPQ